MVCTTRRSRSKSVTVERMTRMFSRRRNFWRSTGEIWPGERMPVATWKSSGWKRWWFRRSMSVISTCPRARRDKTRAAGRPPKPPPTMTTRCGVVRPSLTLPPASVVSRWPCSAAACRGALRFDQPADGVDQGQVRESLVEVAQVFTRGGVDLLRVELQRPGEGQQLLAQGSGPLLLADHGQSGHQPERADGERPLLAFEAGVGRVDLV